MPTDFKALGKQLVASGFGIAASLQVACTFHRITANNFDPATLEAGVTDTTTAINVLFGSFKQKEVDGVNVRRGDKRLLIRQSELAAQPQANDYITENASGTKWLIVGIEFDPTESLWRVHGRAHRP